MARETCPAMLMITSSPAPDSESSVTSVWRLSCHRPTTFALLRTLVHAVLSVVTGLVGSFGCPSPAGKTNHSGWHSPNRRSQAEASVTARLALHRAVTDASA